MLTVGYDSNPVSAREDSPRAVPRTRGIENHVSPPSMYAFVVDFGEDEMARSGTMS